MSAVLAPPPGTLSRRGLLLGLKGWTGVTASFVVIAILVPILNLSVPEGSAWHLKEGELPLSDAQISRYQKRADEAILASAETRRDTLLRRGLARREELYAIALEQGETAVALAVEKDVAALAGLYPDPKQPATPAVPKRPPHDDDEYDDDTAIEPPRAAPAGGTA